VSRRRTTFGKLQRERDKQAKAKAKLERKAQRAEQSEQQGEQPAPQADQATVLAQLAELHAAFDDGQMGLEDFEARRDELTRQLRID
jgi:hypothetical protein